MAHCIGQCPTPPAFRQPERGHTVGQRETGFVVVVKEGFGFIRCAQRDTRVYFNFSQVREEMEAERNSKEI